MKMHCHNNTEGRRDVFLLAAVISLTAAAALFGMSKRGTYTDIRAQENYMDSLPVAELPEAMAEGVCEQMLERLPDAPIILRVLITGEIEHFAGVGRQKARILQIYAGDGLSVGVGQEIYLYAQSWHLSLSAEEDFVDSVERGFINVLQTGEEYLAFARQEAPALERGVPVIEVWDDFAVVPVFSYKRHENKVAPVSEENTYVPYTAVKGNEFFATSEKAIKSLEAVKSALLEKYPAGDSDDIH